LEARELLAADFGDAPDSTAGVGPADYQTRNAAGGPSHVIDVTQTTLFLGNSVDADSGALQNIDADADDVDGVLPDDEDGVLNPLDLSATEGASPQVTLLVTNTTGSVATLTGWIDYDRDGVFDNGTESAQAPVATGTTDGRITLTFPIVPAGMDGKTYARFRISTDAAAQNPTGAASNGEVEDYPFVISGRAAVPATVDSFLKIASSTNGGPALTATSSFGRSVAAIGDVDGDGIGDLAVGAIGDATGGPNRGAVYIVFMNANGTAKSSTKIAHNLNNGPVLVDVDNFGNAVSGIGDLDGDGIPDIAVGAFQDDTGGATQNRGAVYILFLNSDGTVKSKSKIASATGGGPALASGDFFGSGVASIGDIDGDGVSDLAIGAFSDNTGGNGRGAVYITLMNSNGTAKSNTKIANNTNGGPTLADIDLFGSSVASLGDLDSDGIDDIVVGAIFDSTGGTARGAAYVVLLNADGTAKSTTKIASNTGGGPTLADNDMFGESVASPGDLDGDGLPDLVVGADTDDTGGADRGAIYVMLLNSNGSVKSHSKIANNTAGGPTLVDGDRFGASLAPLGDINGDGAVDLAVGAFGDDTGGIGSNRGAIHILRLDPGGLAGDYDHDNDVDGNDVLIWQRNLGSSADPAGSGADGSANGAVDAADLNVWRSSFGVGAASAVAEASSIPNDDVLSVAAVDAAMAGQQFARPEFRPMRKDRIRLAKR
jgi:hypothetical protein